jgi:hypothetical protein
LHQHRDQTEQQAGSQSHSCNSTGQGGASTDAALHTTAQPRVSSCSCLATDPEARVRFPALTEKKI